MPRKADPDYVVDADRGRSTPTRKTATILDRDVADARSADRGGLRELDAMTEANRALHPSTRARERLTPREMTAALGHPLMRRLLPAPRAVRVPFSSRQKKARSKARLGVHAQMPNSQYISQRRLVTRPQRWRNVNDALSESAGDLAALPAGDQEDVRRIDRSIQSYERRNDRGHVLYANVEMPAHINHSNLDGFVANHFAAGEEVAFDRYTVATHQLHESTRDLDASAPEPNPAAGHRVPAAATRTAVFEIATRRGAYLGHSDSLDDTAHLLPRAMTFTITGIHRASYRGPDGAVGERMVIQLTDTATDPPPPRRTS